jgi:hypothetical protein
MIIANLIGGLGNQMFQYACATAIATQTGQKLCYYVDDFTAYSPERALALEDVFGITLLRATQADMVSLIGRWRSISSIRRILAHPSASLLRGLRFITEQEFFYNSDLKKLFLNGGYMHGYWQSEKYFQAFTKEIRKTFCFANPLEPSNKVLVKRITDGPSIGLHVRRGDYLMSTKTLALYAQCDIGYYNKSISFLRSIYPDARLFAFSDDPQWVEEKILKNLPNSECVKHNIGKLSYRDMQMMAMCDNQIIANSSFSWWAAWLNPRPDKIVITPKCWFANSRLDDTDIVPSQWLRF